jgi:hypothetical protein
MHSALFAATIPGVGDRQKWSTFLGAMAKVGVETNTTRLAENVCIVSFSESPSALSWFVASAETHGISYGILPFDAEPQWLPVGFDPKTIRAQNG